MTRGDTAPLPPTGGRSLRHVRAAQLRARATRQAIIQMLLGTVFLVGALAYARAPDRHEQVNLAWMAGLLVLSALDAGHRRLGAAVRRGCGGLAARVGWRHGGGAGRRRDAHHLDHRELVRDRA